MNTSTVISLGLTVCLAGCGGTQKAETTPIAQQSSADEILRIAGDWTSSLPEEGLLSPPSAISLFKNAWTSQLDLKVTSAHETLTITEHLQLRNGGELHCKTIVEQELGVRYGRRKDEAAVELLRPALSVPRSCDGLHPEGDLQKAEVRALFVLRADTLVAVEPPLEKRKYLPIAD